MGKQILITGGAGFIGSHLAQRLHGEGHQVRILDDLVPQVHGERARAASTAQEVLVAQGQGAARTDGTRTVDQGNDDAGASAVGLDGVELLRGDIADPAVVRDALQDVDVVYHLAARVGVGQSLYEMRDYVDTNSLGTAVLLQELVEHPVERLVVASSMSIYGEGLYEAPDGTRIETVERDPEAMRQRKWDPTMNGQTLRPLPTPEEKRPSLASVYALSKYDQERLCLIVGRHYDIPTTALRFFNCYGPGQALGNPYTGVMAIFASQILNGRSPTVYEDGHQQRDFVHVSDVAEACRRAMDAPDADGETINVASGAPRTILQVAEAALEALGSDRQPEVTGAYRAGDVRHCIADTERAERLLGFKAEVGFQEGLRDLVGWLETQEAQDHTDHAQQQLRERGLLS